MKNINNLQCLVLKKVYLLILTFVLSLFLFGCDFSGNHEDLKKFIKAKKSTVKTPIPKKQKEPPQKKHRYVVDKSANPFGIVKLNKTEMDNNLKGDYALSKYPKSDLIMRGTVSVDNETWVILESKKDKMIYRAKVGDRTSFGVIKEITKDEVKIINKGTNNVITIGIDGK